MVLLIISTVELVGALLLFVLSVRLSRGARKLANEAVAAYDETRVIRGDVYLALGIQEKEVPGEVVAKEQRSETSSPPEA